MRAGETAQRTAERLLRADDPIVRLPAHVEEMRAAARAAAAGDPLARRELERVIERWRGRVEALGQAPAGGTGAYTIKSATQALVEDLREAGAEGVDRALDRWVLERARYQARQVARHETVEAYRDAYRTASSAVPAVKGYRWRLSPAHPRPDVCDLYANQDLHGLGPGGYPVGEVPETPHPNCLCTQVAIVDDQAMRRELAIARGEPEPPRPWESGTRRTAAEWLGRQPADFREKLLGPTRSRIFRSDPDRVIAPGGAPIPVHQVLGQPPPARRAGPAVRARPLVEADTASMVAPFPSLPRRRRRS